MVDRRVRLDHVVDLVLVGRGDLALDRADDAGRDRAVSPNGLPIATTESPTWTTSELPSVKRRQRAGAGVFTLSTAMSVDGSEPTSVALMLVLFEKPTWIDWRPGRRGSS